MSRKREEVEPDSGVFCFLSEIKADKVNFSLSLIGYSKEQKIISTNLVGNADVEELIEAAFRENAKIDYLHVHNAEACCYICRIERV